jgi:hypothetical protein
MLNLYDQERQIYGEILALCKQQGEIIRCGNPFQELRRVLQQKREHLDAISALERSHEQDRTAWMTSRKRFSGGGRAMLQQALQRVAALIEEILLREEENDRLLLEETRPY